MDAHWFALAVSADARTGLQAARDLVARELVTAEPGQIAGLVRELRATILAIEALPTASKGGLLDELAAQRAARAAARITDTDAASQT